jgi:hypothetical protein
VLGRERADARHRLDDVTGPRLGHRAVLLDTSGCVHRRRGSRRGFDCGAGFDHLHDVALGHAAGDAAALEAGNLDAVLGGDLSYERRRLGAESIFHRLAVAG